MRISLRFAETTQPEANTKTPAGKGVMGSIGRRFVCIARTTTGNSFKKGASLEIPNYAEKPQALQSPGIVAFQ